MAGTTGLGVCIVVYLCVIQAFANCGDGEGCFCFDTTAFCNNPTKFPTNLPREISMLSIADMHISSIPSDALSGLPFLKELEIHSSNIRTISSGAFRGLVGLRYFGFYKNNVDTIESYAFADMQNIETMSMHFTTIREIEANAFYNLENFADININSMNISKIRNRAFNNMQNIKRFQFYMNDIGHMEARSITNMGTLANFEMYLNHFGTFGCENIEPLIAKTETSFYSNGVSCDCGLSWVIGNAALARDMFSNWCEMPGTSKHFYFNELRRHHLSCTENSDDGCPAELTTPQPMTTGSTAEDTEHRLSENVVLTQPDNSQSVVLTISEEQSYQETETEVTSTIANTVEPVDITTKSESMPNQPQNHLTSKGSTGYESTESPRDGTTASESGRTRSTLFKVITSANPGSITRMKSTTATGSATEEGGVFSESLVPVNPHMSDGLLPLAANEATNLDDNTIITMATNPTTRQEIRSTTRNAIVSRTSSDATTVTGKTRQPIIEEAQPVNVHISGSSRVPVYLSVLILSIFISLLSI